jgi:hypothetical protein
LYVADADVLAMGKQLYIRSPTRIRYNCTGATVDVAVSCII